MWNLPRSNPCEMQRLRHSAVHCLCKAAAAVPIQHRRSEHHVIFAPTSSWIEPIMWRSCGHFNSVQTLLIWASGIPMPRLRVELGTACHRACHHHHHHHHSLIGPDLAGALWGAHPWELGWGRSRRVASSLLGLSLFLRTAAVCHSAAAVSNLFGAALRGGTRSAGAPRRHRCLRHGGALVAPPRAARASSRARRPRTGARARRTLGAPRRRHGRARRQQ